MRSVLFWLAVALMIAAVSHLSYVLIAPSFAMQRLIGAAQDDTPVNKLVLLDGTEQLRLLGETERDALSAKCLFDITGGELHISANMPDTFWSLTLYSAKGADLYTINDRQAGGDTFKLSIRRAPGFLEVLKGDQSETARALSNGWSVDISEPTGVAVFWMALDFPEQRKLFTEILSRSSCTFTPSAAS